MMFSHVAAMAGSLVLVAAVLSPSDVERIESYGAAWALTADDAQPLTARARVEFAGRGTEIANRFLLHTDAPPRNDAYFFVLRAVGDTETALTLIRALSGRRRKRRAFSIAISERSGSPSRRSSPAMSLAAIQRLSRRSRRQSRRRGASRTAAEPMRRWKRYA
jgi:hypothetical protein